MLNCPSIFALAAVAALATTVLAPTTASARGHGGGRHIGRVMGVAPHRIMGVRVHPNNVLGCPHLRVRNSAGLGLHCPPI
jgi:hypothetical protein